MDKAVEIKDELIREAMEITRAASEREAIERAGSWLIRPRTRRRGARGRCEMDKTIEIDDELLRQLQEATGEQTVRQAVEHVLKDYVEARRKHADLLALIGKVRFRDDHDPRSLKFSGNDAD